MSTSSAVRHDPLDEDKRAHPAHPGDLLYIKVAIVLAVLTAIEVATYFIDFRALFVPALIGLMLVKFFTVVWYFMHLKFDSRLFRRVFYAGLATAIAIYVATLTAFQFWTAGA